MHSSLLPLPVSLGAEQLTKIAGRFGYLSDLESAHFDAVAVVRSPHPAARVVAIAADDLGPDIDLITPDDVPSTPFCSVLLDEELDAQMADRRLLTRSPRFVGDAVAAIVAPTPADAARAAAAVDVRYEVDEAITAAEPLAAATPRCRISVPGSARSTEPAPSVTVRQRTGFDAAHHLCLETYGCAAWTEDDELVVVTNTQSPGQLREVVAEFLATRVARVRVIKLQEGGGFGLRQDIFDELLVAYLAMSTGRPLKHVYGRHEEFIASRVRARGELDLELGVDSSGLVTSALLHATLDAGAYLSHSPCVLSCIGGHVAAQLPPGACDFEGLLVGSNTTPSGAYRGYGAGEASQIVEPALARAARRLGHSWFDVRRRNLSGDREGRRAARCLDALEAWSCRAAVGRDRVVAIGQGLGRKESVGSTSPPFESGWVSLRIQPNGAIELLTGTVDSGTGSDRGLATLAAEVLGSPIEQTTVIGGDSASVDSDLGSAAQRSIFVGGTAVTQTAELLRRRIITAATILSGRPAEGLDLRWPYVVDILGRRITDVESLASDPRVEPLVAEGSTGVRTTGTSHCAVEIELSVDLVTGVISARRVRAVIDIGPVVDRRSATGQVVGSIVNGLGLGLIEGWTTGDVPSRPTFALHGAIRAADVPPIDVEFLPPVAAGQPPSGVGELAVAPTLGALSVAVWQAIGGLPERTPYVTHRVRRALDQAGVAAA